MSSSNPALRALRNRASRTRGRADAAGRPVTIDDVVTKTAGTAAATVLAAVVTWILAPADSIYAVSGAAALCGFALSVLISLVSRVSPGLVLVFAVAEGVFLGGVSKSFESVYDGVVTGAVVGTAAGFIGVIAAYKLFDVSVSSKVRRVTTAAMLGFVILMALNLVMALFGVNMGLSGFGPLGVLMSVIGLGLSIVMLFIDLEDIERVIDQGCDASIAWQSAFALTVTLVRMYVNLLKILGALRQ